jgi:hypothetical protein
MQEKSNKRPRERFAAFSEHASQVLKSEIESSLHSSTVRYPYGRTTGNWSERSLPVQLNHEYSSTTNTW